MVSLQTVDLAEQDVGRSDRCSCCAPRTLNRTRESSFSLEELEHQRRVELVVEAWGGEQGQVMLQPIERNKVISEQRGREGGRERERKSTKANYNSPNQL